MKFAVGRVSFNQHIQHAISCLSQNNLRGSQMFYKWEKPRLLYFKQNFHALEVILQQKRDQLLHLYATQATKEIFRH